MAKEIVPTLEAWVVGDAARWIELHRSADNALVQATRELDALLRVAKAARSYMLHHKGWESKLARSVADLDKVVTGAKSKKR